MGGVEVGRIDWGYLLGGIVEFGFRDLFLCDDDDNDLYDDLQQPPPGFIQLDFFFFKTTNQAKTQSNVSTDSVQMRIIDFLFPFLTNNPCTDLRPFLSSYC